MAIYLSAGHHNADPGAGAVDGRTEAQMTIDLRNRVMTHIKSIGDYRVITDDDNETLAQYLKRIRPGSGSVVCDIHFNAFNGVANGVEVIIPAPSTERERKFNIWEKIYGAIICRLISSNSGLNDRGVKDEKASHRGRLGLMREDGINLLIEVCFIDNKMDIAKYDLHKDVIAASIAKILCEADDKFK